jgi:membrane protein implicated in regulation of membrane protease activity
MTVMVTAEEASDMSWSAWVAIGGVAAGIVLLWLLPFWAAVLVMLGVPAAAYLLLDPSQRRRLRRAGRKELGR